MSLHGSPIIEEAHLPDGRQVQIRVGIAQDSYIDERDMDTVVLEVRIGRGVVAVMDTILGSAQVSEARHLANRVREGLTCGTLEPSTASLGPLTDQLL